MLRQLIQSISGLISEKKEVAPPPQPPAVEPAGEGQPAPGPAPVSTAAGPSDIPVAAPTITAGASADKMLDQGLDYLREVSKAFQDQNPLDPRYFILNRLVAWLGINTLPPSTNGQTMIPPPEEQVAGFLKKQYQNGTWDELLAASESRVGQFLFWLDLSFYSAEALRQTGHPELSDIISAETARFVSRLPEVVNFSFSDGTPFASPPTRQWLHAIGSGSDSGVGSGSGTSPTDAIIAQALEEAEKLLAENKFISALNPVLEQMNQTVNCRERFLWEIALCNLLVRARKVKIAWSYMGRILEKIEKFNLEEWEPELALEALVTVLSILQLVDDKETEDQRHQIIDRITVLNPIRALALD
jgi:type VI secretion system protein VasJ